MFTIVDMPVSTCEQVQHVNCEYEPFIAFLKLLSIQRTLHHQLNVKPNSQGLTSLQSYIDLRTLKCSR